MRMFKLIVLGLLVASNGSVSASGTASLKLEAPVRSVKVGAGVMVQVTVTNQSDHPITYHNLSRVCDYSIKVLTGAGVAAPETAYYKNERARCGNGELKITNRNITVTLKPGESGDELIELTELYDMSQPGQYSVQVDRKLTGIGELSSNVVLITVTP
jgi:hypothetical protein